MIGRSLDRVSEVYAGTASDAVFQRHLRARIHWTCRQVKGRRVLDVGCSQGIVSLLLAREGFEVVGIDLEPSAIEQAQAALAEESEAVRSKVWFLQGDVFSTEVDLGSFDTVIAGEIMEHLVQPSRLAARCGELLTEGGRFIVTVPFGVHPHPDHKTTFYLSNLLEALGEGFSPVGMELIHTSAGSGSPVPIIGLVAEKIRAPHLPGGVERQSWLEFAERAFTASEERYRATVEYLEQRVSNWKEQATKLQSAQADLATRERESRDQLASLRAEQTRLQQEAATKSAAMQQERALAEKEWQAKLVTAEHARALAEGDWQAKLVTAEQTRAQAESDWQAKLDAAQQARTQVEKEWQAKLATAQQERAQAEQRLRSQMETLEKAVSVLRSDQEKLVGVLGEAESAVNGLAAERDLLRQDLTAWVSVEQRLRHGLKERDQVLRQLQRRLAMMEDATSYRLGLLLVRCAQRPYLFLLLPYRVVELAVSALRRRSLKRQGKLDPRFAPLPRDPAPSPEPVVRRSTLAPAKTTILARISAVRGGLGKLPAAPPKTAPPAAAAPPPPPPAPAPAKVEVKPSLPTLTLPPPPPVEIPPAPVRGLNLRVAAILDEFSWMCWSYECDLLKLTPENWREVLSTQRPDFVFIESAWFGKNKEWGPIVVFRTRLPKDPLPEMLAWCREQRIPTVFWNKEDPVHNEYFMEAARLFDFVFTTDANCLPRYREALGHDRCFALPFAAQPMVHNPAPVEGGRPYEVAFAGSWHTKAHDARRTGADIVLRPALKHGLHIYDRNFGATVQPERYAWPEEFVPSVVGGVSYREMLAVYRQYKVFLNINSVTDSPTMFSRRVFELLACGTPVISSYARGIDEMLGRDTVFLANTPEETEAHLQHLLGDNRARQVAVERGIAAVMSAHTYGHRLRDVVERIGGAGAALAPMQAARDDQGKVVPQESPRVHIPPNSPGLCLPPPPKAVVPDGPNRRPGLLVGTIVDEVFEPCWRYEAEWVTFTPQNWRETLSRTRPRFLFIDSAWRGNRFAWRFHLQRLKRMDPIGPSPEFEELMAWCRKEKLPTVFWNREDPPNYPHFIGAAKLCDYIFTTDSDCLPRYREDCGHDRVGVLPFGAQPRIHNPIAVPGGRGFDLNFAGTWYATKHAERIEQMEAILRPALAYGVHIWDRRLYHTLDDHFRYPEEFRPHIAGSLTYEETLAVMKQYRISLNVNSVINSPTMSSCRVFEGLMAGSAVISGYTRSLDLQLGQDLVPLPKTPEETAHWIETFLDDEDLRARTVHLAQRKILEEHTYSQRFDHVLRTIGLDEFALGDKPPLVSALSVVESLEQADRVLESFTRQTYPAKELVLVAMGESGEAVARRAGEKVKVLRLPADRALGDCLETALRESAGQHVTVLAPEHYYGPRFLSDLMLTREYADAGIIGKRAHYVRAGEGLALRHAGAEQDFVSSVAPSAMLVAREVFAQSPLGTLTASEEGEFFARCRQAGVRIFSADRFNYAAAPGPGEVAGVGERTGGKRRRGSGAPEGRVTL